MGDRLGQFKGEMMYTFMIKSLKQLLVYQPFECSSIQLFLLLT